MSLVHPTHSLIIPVYKNEANIESLFVAINGICEQLGNALEVVFVVDGSPDKSYALIEKNASSANFPFQLVELSRNFGAFTAIRTGMESAKGQYMAVMAADLQEPIELIIDLFDVLQKNSADVAFGQRVERNDPYSKTLLSNTYWSLYRKFVLPDIPKGGIDIFACNRLVANSLLQIEEPNSSLVAQLFWVGYRRAFIPYTRQPRIEGESAWSLRKRFRYMLDSIFSYSDSPLMLIFWIGLTSFILSAVIGGMTLVGKLFGWIDVPGYAGITLLILFFGSATILTQGIIGCYLWRTFENTKKRPLSIVQRRNEFPSGHIGKPE